MKYNYTVNVGDYISSSSSFYQVEQIVGSGTYGIVALCHKNKSSHIVALKVFKNLSHRKFGQREAKILRLLMESGSTSHHIVQWLDSFEYLGHYFLEFEKLDICLRTFLLNAPNEHLELNHIRPILTQIAEALLFLKSIGLMHCDLKPANIMMVDHVGQPLHIKLIDFGLAHAVGEAKEGSMLMTLYYRAPEVVVGAPLSEAIDMWSLGCIAVEMFLGEFLFMAINNNDLIRMIVQLLGQLPKHVLDSGRHTHKYFILPEGSPDWIRKVTTVWTIPMEDPFSIETERNEAEDCDRIVFIDLIKRMLDLDPETRISPEQVLDHPFIIMTHLAKGDHEYALKSKKVQIDLESGSADSPEVQSAGRFREASLTQMITVDPVRPNIKRMREENEVSDLDCVCEIRKRKKKEVSVLD